MSFLSRVLKLINLPPLLTHVPLRYILPYMREKVPVKKKMKPMHVFLTPEQHTMLSVIANEFSIPKSAILRQLAQKGLTSEYEEIVRARIRRAKEGNPDISPAEIAKFKEEQGLL